MKRVRAVVPLIFLSLTACSGSAQVGTVLSPALTAAGPAPAAMNASAQFSITIPADTSTDASARRPAFISAATLSGIIKITAVDGVAYSGAPTSLVVNATTAAPNCTGTPLTCTMIAPAAVGVDTFSITTYDALQPATAGATPAGHVLGSATISVNIVANSTNIVPIVLAGVPASIAITGVPSATAGTAFGTRTLVVTVKDAGGKIIAGTYATPIVLANSDTSGATVIATSGTDNPPAQTLLSSSDVATLTYSGLAIVPASIAASADTATTTTSAFAPVLAQILTNVQGNRIALSSSVRQSAFTASEVGWTNAPFNKAISVSAGTGCGTVATIAPSSGMSFTATAVASPVPGTCTFTLTDFSGGRSANLSVSFANLP